MRRWILALLCACACNPAAPPEQQTSAPPPAATPSPAPPPAAPDEAAGIAYLVRYTGGARPDATLPLVVAIHGLGDRPERFGLLAGFDGEARVIVPRALHRHGAGFSWFDIAVRGERDVAAVAAGTRAAAGRLAQMIAALRERYPTRGKAIVTGFSQGGMLSFALAVLHPEHIRLALPVAGWLPPPLWPNTAEGKSTAEGKAAPPIVALHGADDQILPLAPTVEAVSALRRAGVDAQLIEYPGVGHGVSGQMRRELYRRLAEATASE